MMKITALRLSLSTVLFTTLAATACSVKSTDTPTATDGGVSATPDASTPADVGALGFAASNLDLTGIDLSKIGDYVVDDPNCTIDSGQNLASCGDGAQVLAFKIQTMSDGSKLGVYVARSFKVPAGMLLTVQGSLPIALVALGTIEIEGSFHGNATRDLTIAGGRTSETNTATIGGRPEGTTKSAGSGGGFCGSGGAAAAEVGTGLPGGLAFGTSDLIPLLGGSAGGDNIGLHDGGGGGGAIELVAKTSITIAAGAVIHVGGGGGSFGGAAGAADGQEASGGGSGGAILVESPIVTIAGTLAANGGGGGGGTSNMNPGGADATATSSPALGGQTANISRGGDGSAASNVDGAPGMVTAGETAGGGGGAAGRIRINTASGKSSLIAATLSPTPATACVTQGKLH